MGSTMQDLSLTRNNPEYRNFIAVGDATRILGDGLRHFAEQKAKELHTLLLKKLPGVQCTCLCTPGVKSRRHTCQWSKELEKLHANRKKSRIPFHQSDCTQWHDPTNGYWEIAKVFMSDLGKKWRDVKDPVTTDLTGLLNLMIFCKHFNVQQNLLEPVRDLRNEWAHSPNLMLSESQKQVAFVHIEKLMNDVELMSCKEVQDCRSGVKEVENADVSIVQERDLLVLRELTKCHEHQKERQTKKEQTKLVAEKIKLILSSNKLLHTSSYGSANQFEDEKTHKTTTLIISLFLLTVQVLAKGSRAFSPWPRLFLVMLFLSLVGHMPDDGCSRLVKISPVDAFGFNEFDFTTLLSHKRENFFGRSWFFRELDDIFESNNAPVGVLVTGDPGSGKSALMSQLICSPFSSLEIYDNIIGYHICDYSEKGSRDGASFVRNLVHQIASNVPEYAAHIVDKKQIRIHLNKRCDRDPTACFRTTVIGPLRELRKTPDNFKYIVIDALDECVEKEGETSAILDILRHRMSYFPQWLKVIMSSRNGSTVTSRVPLMIPRMPLDPADERNIEDIRSYILRYLREKASFVSKLLKAIYPMEDTSSEVTNELTERAEGNFLFVKTVLKSNVESDGTINLNSLPINLNDMYYQAFQRYFVKEDFDRYEILFEIILASGSLLKTEVFEILKRENQGKEMHDLIEHVSPLLHFGQDDTVSIYHHAFAEWLMNNNNRLRGFTIQIMRGHEYIANFLVDRAKESRTITFNELTRLCTHVLYTGGPSKQHKGTLKLLNVTNIRNEQNGKCILHELAKMENGSRLLEIFLPSFTSVDITDLEGKTPAYYAASRGLVDILKLFLEKGACANCILNSVPSLDEIKSVIQMKRYEELSIMHVATYNGYTKVIDMLLKHNATLMKFNKNVPTLLHVAAERGHIDIVELLYDIGAEADPLSLHHAAARNNSLVVNYLLEIVGVKDECLQYKPTNVPHQNRSFDDVHSMFCETALHAAVSKGYTNIAKRLLQFGNSAMECKHHSGKTPLMDAVERNNTEIAEILLKNGAKVEEKCGDELSLNFSELQTSGILSYHGKRFLYTIYREKTSCACGNKALHLCAKYGLWHMAKILINNWNASVLDRNCNGETVWKIANVSHNQDFIYHVNRMLLNLDVPTSRQLGMPKYQRRALERLLRKFFMRTKPYDSSFECDPTFEGMSPLHIAALMGVDMLKYVYKDLHEIAPSLPLNCTHKYWITPEYLAHLYDGNRALTDEKTSSSKQTPGSKNTLAKTMLQYPDREAEFHMIYNHFYHSPTDLANVLTYRSLSTLANYDVTQCPGFYDLLPESKDLKPKPYCNRLPGRGRNCEEDDEEDDDPPDKSALQKMQYCKGRHHSFCVCVYEMEQRMMFEQYAKDCFCPIVMSEIQRWFTNFPKRNRRNSHFIAERMGWKDSSNSDVTRWPVYFLYKKLKNEYKPYKYLQILNKGFKIDSDDEDDED